MFYGQWSLWIWIWNEKEQSLLVWLNKKMEGDRSMLVKLLCNRCASPSPFAGIIVWLNNEMKGDRPMLVKILCNRCASPSLFAGILVWLNKKMEGDRSLLVKSCVTDVLQHLPSLAFSSGLTLSQLTAQRGPYTVLFIQMWLNNEMEGDRSMLVTSCVTDVLHHLPSLALSSG